MIRSRVRPPSSVPGPLRIAVIAACPFPTLQGSQVLIRQHAEAMAARGHTVHLIAYHHGLRLAHADHRPQATRSRHQAVRSRHQAARSRIRVHRIPRVPFYRRLKAGPSLGKPMLDLLLAWKVWRVARRERIDVFHAHNIEGLIAAWPAARWLRRPLVFHTHTLMELELPAYFRSSLARRIARRAGRWLDVHLPRAADCTIALSPEARVALIRHGVPADRLVVLPPGVDEDSLCLSHERTADPAVENHLGNGPLAIYTGNLDPYQGLDDLLRAFAEVRRRLPEAQLVIASHAELQPTIDLRADGIRFIRVRDFAAAARLLAAADVAVCPRPACMGYPIKLLNYMAAGKAIVCAAGSARDLVHLDNGYLYSDGDVAELAEGLIRLMTDRPLAQQMGDNARQTVRGRRWSGLATAFEALYSRLLAAEPARLAPRPALESESALRLG